MVDIAPAPPDPTASGDATEANPATAATPPEPEAIEPPEVDPAAALAGDPEPTDAPADEAPKKSARSAEPPPTPPPADRLEGAIESVLLASGEAISAERLRDLLGLPSAVHVREALARIRERWAAARLPIEIQDVAGGHRVTTRPEYAEYVRRLVKRAAVDRLSPTLLETLSVVAYRQPVARAEIEAIRGVQCAEHLRILHDRHLVKTAGRSEQPGRPFLYATTSRFLEVFGLSGLEDLPNAKDLQRM